jgi:hypothetical protein
MRFLPCVLPCALGGALILGAAAVSSAFTEPAHAQANVSAGVAPPPLPDYAQPPIPGPG